MQIICHIYINYFQYQGPIVQSIVSLSSLVIKMLTVLISTKQKFTDIFAEKMWVAFANGKATHIFLAKIIVCLLVLRSWSISTKECCQPQWGLNPRLPRLQSDGASKWAIDAGTKLLHYAVLNNQSLNDTLTNHIISFEQLGSVLYWYTSQVTEDYMLS